MYIIRISHFDTDTLGKELRYTEPADAWKSFREFATPDSFEIYSRVELVEYSFEEDLEYPLAQLTFLD